MRTKVCPPWNKMRSMDDTKYLLIEVKHIPTRIGVETLNIGEACVA